LNEDVEPMVRRSEVQGPSLGLVLIETISLILLVIIVVISTAEAAETPELNVTSPEEGLLTNNATLHVTGTQVDARYMAVQVESSEGERNYTDLLPKTDFNITVELWEGINRVTVYAIEDPIQDFLEGNMTNATKVLRLVTLDTVPPELTISSPKEWPTYTRHHTITITGTVIYGPDEITFPRPPDAPHSGVFTQEVPLLVGENMIDIRFSDEAGNEVVEWVYVIADWTPPTVLIEKPWPDPYITNNGTIEFEGKVGMGALRVKLMFDHREYDVTTIVGNMETCATWYFTLPRDDVDIEDIATVMAFDIAGNVAHDNVTIHVDTIPPVIEVWPFPEYSNTPFLWINGSVSEDDIERIAVNEVPYPLVDGRFTILWSLQGGYNPFSLTVEDGVGNLGRADVIAYYGSKNPSLDVLRPKRLGGNTYLVSGSCSDYIDQVEIDGNWYPVVDAEFAARVEVSSGTKRVLVRVVDPEGNEAEEWVQLGMKAETPTSWFLMALVAAIAIASVVSFLLIRRRRGRQP
jgi:hypothetical protein